MGIDISTKGEVVLVVAVAVTVMAVAWTGWVALRDLEDGAEPADPTSFAPPSPLHLRLVEPAGR